MDKAVSFYINGAWVAPHSTQTIPVVNPASEAEICQLALGDRVDVDRAVTAAATAFETWGQTSPQERKPYLHQIIDAYRVRLDDMADAVRMEMGAPKDFALSPQSDSGLSTFETMLAAMDDVPWQGPVSASAPDAFVMREPIGVCALITPLELAHFAGGDEGGGRHSGRMHHGAETFRTCAPVVYHFSGND